MTQPENQNDVFNYFTESIQTQITIAETLNPKIEQVIQTLLTGLLANRTLFISANGFLMPSMMNFTHQLFNGLEIDRPAIPIVSLSSSLALLTQLDHAEPSLHEAKQINAFAKPKDILIVLSYSGREAHLVACMKEAIEKEMALILFRSQRSGELSELLGANDLEIEIPTTSKLTLIEMQTLILNCISQTLEARLFLQNDVL